MAQDRPQTQHGLEQGLSCHQSLLRGHQISAVTRGRLLDWPQWVLLCQDRHHMYL